ncbi:MAG: NUDIX hydrolase [Bacteroidota bacterium]
MTIKTDYFKTFKNTLYKCFSKELPGKRAHIDIAPLYRKGDIEDLSIPSNAVKSSVLFLFYEKEGDVLLVFIRRNIYNGAHSGQISLPGGRWEKNDKDLYHTALRETWEELGIPSSDITFAGKLSDIFIPPSNFIVSPYVGIYPSEKPPVFTPDPREVADIIEIPFSFFLQKSGRKNVSLSIGKQQTITAPAFVYKQHIIWGATAMMVNELVFQWKTIAL